MLVNIQFHDLIGTAGVFLTLFAYFLLQLGKWDSKELRFSLANVFGSGMILYSLVHDFNLSGFLIESIWVLISFYGVYKSSVAKPA